MLTSDRIDMYLSKATVKFLSAFPGVGTSTHTSTYPSVSKAVYITCENPITIPTGEMNVRNACSFSDLPSSSSIHIVCSQKYDGPCSLQFPSTYNIHWNNTDRETLLFFWDEVVVDKYFIRG